ncbi:hypothetical protein [Streptomyces purpureus]|uniref:Uncharacterized protein n=1 Tax=Streptomyces purpureus TaxID=1951 RepID=A0A918LSJ5_9ACTN|nr:hypothetical protein [Streptomyces purpureus]GGT43317.1 hypothetical protein GCM10014713_41220 [Streptomyces purpureus]
MPNIIPRAESMQYDGTNALAVAEWIGATAHTVDEGVLTLTIPMWGEDMAFRLHPGWWLIRDRGVCGGSHSPEDYARIWRELPTV